MQSSLILLTLMRCFILKAFMSSIVFFFLLLIDMDILFCVQLPDYHEIIKQPMDFGTVRRKLDEGLYSNLEELEVCIVIISLFLFLYSIT